VRKLFIAIWMLAAFLERLGIGLQTVPQRRAIGCHDQTLHAFVRPACQLSIPLEQKALHFHARFFRTDPLYL
jgi:hypothetical protein